MTVVLWPGALVTAMPLVMRDNAVHHREAYATAFPRGFVVK